MQSDNIKAIFDQQAAGYDTRWAKTAPIRDALHFLLEAVFAGLPAQARILCVGAGTGEDIDYLAKRHPRWTFTAVEPSGAMLDICRRKAEAGAVTKGFVDANSFSRAVSNPVQVSKLRLRHWVSTTYPWNGNSSFH